MPQQTKSQQFKRMLKAVLLISLAPMTVFLMYGLMGRMALDHAVLGIITILIGATIFIQPFIANIHALTFYVRQLAQDKQTEEPDLSFLNNVEELSDALNQLTQSWEKKRHQLEAALAENKIVIEVLPDPIFILDNTQKIARANGIARHMFGHRLIGKQLDEIIPNNNLLESVKHVQQVSEIEFNIDSEIRRDYIGKVTKFPANSPSQTDAILTLHDLTELKQIRRMRADFVANASHEMKTPLASIIGLIETLQTSAKSDAKARKEFLLLMANQAQRMNQLITDLLSLSKIEAETNAPETDADIQKTLEEVKENFDWFGGKKNSRIQMHISPDLPLIKGDASQLAQVFTNLLANSFKYSYPDSEITLHANITRKVPIELNEKFDKAIEISIADKSSGIAKKHIPRLTERFYRVDDARSKQDGGTGLGLAIVKHILNRHGGILKIVSEKNVGSVFSVYLPLKAVN